MTEGKRTSWLNRKLNEVCVCGSLKTYRSCCLRKETAYFGIAALVGAGLFVFHNEPLIIALIIVVAIILGWLIARQHRTSHKENDK